MSAVPESPQQLPQRGCDGLRVSSLPALPDGHCLPSHPLHLPHPTDECPLSPSLPKVCDSTVFIMGQDSPGMG